MTRPTFQQRGIVDLRRLPAGMLAQLLPVLLLGAILTALAVHQFYLLIVMPLIAVIIPAMLSSSIAGWLRWREPRIAGTVGFVIGVLAYLSQYYVTLLYFNGIGFLWRLDIAGAMVIWQMENQAIGDAGVNVVENWMYLCVELSLVGSVFAFAHVFVTNRLYCPDCGATLKSKSSILPPFFATELAIGINENRLDDLPLDESNGEIEGNAWSNVELLYCFHGKAENEPLFYLTLRETRFEGSVGKAFSVLDKVALSDQEMLAITEKCPRLAVARAVDNAA